MLANLSNSGLAPFERPDPKWPLGSAEGPVRWPDFRAADPLLAHCLILVIAMPMILTYPESMEKQNPAYLVECPRTQQAELVEVQVSKLPVLQLHPPLPVSCSQLENAQECGNCLPGSQPKKST